MNKIPDFKIGDIVKLMSGGVPMTILCLYEDSCRVIWMNSVGDLQSNTVSKSVLRFLNDEEYQCTK